MGGKSSGQVAGYRYFGNLVVMIGNRIEELKAINFDKRGWQINDEQKISPLNRMFYDGDFDFTLPSIYGEDEGGIAGKIGLRLGYAEPQADAKYAEYLASKSFPALTYPYLSYLVFKGRKPISTTSIIGKKISVLPLSESGFYFGNNPFLKEMMLWVKRIYVRNDGRQQWYSDKAGIPDFSSKAHGEFEGSLQVSVNYTAIVFGEATQVTVNNVEESAWNKTWSIAGIVDTNYPTHYPYNVSQDWTITYSSGVPLYIEFAVNLMVNLPDYAENSIVTTSGDITVISITTVDHDSPDYGGGQTKTIRAILPATFKGEAYINTSGTIVSSTIGWHKGSLRWVSPEEGETWREDFEATDINPIHKIREILTDDTAMGIPESEINDEIFIRAADQIYDEGLGISCAFTEKNCKEALDEICSHIEAGVRVNRQTGKYEVVLFRDDWLDLEYVQHFDKTNIKRGSFSVEVMNTDDAINVLNVNYYDRANIKDSSFNVYENGLIQTIGHENAETVEFPYFMNQRTAEVVANWKLKQLSTPAWKGSFVTSSRAARKLNRYDVITISWASKQISNMPVRVMKINLGTTTDTAVMIEFIEVVAYSNANYSNVVVDDSVSQVLPPQPARPTVFEVPYYALVQLLGQREVDARILDNPELGYVGVAQEKPQSNSLNALLYTDGGTGVYTDFDKVGVIDYCDGVYLDQSINQIDNVFLVADLDYVQNGAPKFTALVGGTIGRLNGELLSFVAYDSETKLLTVKRGVLDTIPKSHTDGKITFWGEAFGYDTREYVLGEEVGVQVLTTTPSGVGGLNVDAVKTIEINARAIRPYPPANVKINGEYWPEEVQGYLELNWAHRNRLQQSGGAGIGYFDAGVTIENGVTYKLAVYVIDASNIQTEFFNQNVGDVNSYTVDLSTAPATAVKFRIVLNAVRDIYESYQTFDYTLNLSFTAPYNITYSVVTV